MNEMKVFSIGRIENNESGARIVLDPAYAKGLLGLGDYSHMQVLWWASECDNEEARTTIVERRPYKNGPDTLGVFATRAPERPNPVAVSSVDIAYVDEEAGVIGLYYIDAFDGTPVLDVKPYTPSIDRVEQPRVPDWCSHWPQSYEASGEFDWAAEFNF